MRGNLARMFHMLRSRRREEVEEVERKRYPPRYLGGYRVRAICAMRETSGLASFLGHCFTLSKAGGKN